MILRLVPIQGTTNHLNVPPGGDAFELYLKEGKSYIIGRVETADLRLQHRTVGRHVLSVGMAGETVTIRDLGSGGGSMLNGVVRPAGARLSTGDTLSIGELAFRVEFAADAEN
jgi:pSer/pThr/pTyr-binding forkhead associated (FHA) protein